MRRIERFWSYLLYVTWKLISDFGRKLIEAPVFKIASLIPYFRRNIEKGKGIHERVMHAPDISFTIIFAIRHMYALTTCIYISIFLWIKYFLKFDICEYYYYWVGGILTLAYITDEILLLHNDKYLKYFSEFEKSIKNKRKVYLHAILFHVVVLIFTVLTLDWTIGIW